LRISCFRFRVLWLDLLEGEVLVECLSAALRQVLEVFHVILVRALFGFKLAFVLSEVRGQAFFSTKID
jgi:hypothetical protein